MRAAARGAVALLLSVGPLLVATPAHADSSNPPVIKSAWYWAEKETETPVKTLPELPDAANAASLVPDGDLGVGYLLEQLSSKDKMAALDFDLTTIPVGSSFSSFVLTIPVDSAAQTVGLPDISACENIDTFTDAATPQVLSKAPPYAAPTCVKGTLASGVWTFNLTAIANEWSQGTPAFGIAIVPTLLPTMTPFTTALKGKNAVVVKASWSPPVTEEPTEPSEPVVPTVPEVAPPPAVSGDVPVVPVVPDVQQPVGAAPQVPAPQANPAPQAVALRPAAYVPRSLTPSTQWWIALLALAVLLALAWITQSDPLVPAPADPRRARFARAVRSA